MILIFAVVCIGCWDMAGEERYGGKRKDMAGKGKIWREEQLQHHYLAKKRVAKMAGRVFSDPY